MALMTHEGSGLRNSERDLKKICKGARFGSGMAIARRMGYGMKIVIGDKSIQNAETISKIMNEAGFDTEAVEMELSSRKSIRNIIEKAQSFEDELLATTPAEELLNLPLLQVENIKDTLHAYQLAKRYFRRRKQLRNWQYDKAGSI